MSTPSISVSGIHRFFGSLHAVKGISFDVQPGEVVGFIGANGAGKTTTMRMMATLDSPDEGKISICGIDVTNHPLQVRRKIGWMPDAYGAYPNMTVEEYLDFFARSFGYRGAERRQRVAEVMDFTELTPLTERPVNSLSKGMGQRLCLGRTLIHDPPVLILDEPAAGLDPKARIEFKHLIRILAEEGKTIFISSHILTELGEMCDLLLFIDNGRIVHQGSTESLTRGEESGAAVAIEVAGDPEALAQWVSLHQGVSLMESRKDGCLVRFDENDPTVLTATLRKMLNEELPIVGFRREERKLEDAFVALLNKLEGQGDLPTLAPDSSPAEPVAEAAELASAYPETGAENKHQQPGIDQ